MCGLVGVAGNLFKKEIDAFNDLLWCDSVRGRDSTGVAAVKPNGDVIYLKALGPASEIMEMRGYNDVVAMNHRVIIGHNRFGTMGAKSKTNAHPFVFDGVVGAHNGTVDYQSKGRMKDGGTFGTDSEAIYHNVDHEGIDATIPKLDGAWALTYVNRDENTLNLIRNDKRPLFYCYGKDRKAIFWASEYGMLMWCLARNGVEIEGNVHQLPVDLLHTWDITKGGEVFKDPETRGIEGFKKLPDAQQNFQQRWPMLDRRETPPAVSSAKPNVAPSEPSSGKGDNVPQGDSSPFATKQAILDAIETVLSDANANWWDNHTLVQIFDSDDTNPWAWWAEDETSEVWLMRVKTMLNLGWEFGDENASPALKPVTVAKKPDVVVARLEPTVDEAHPVISSAGTSIWNPKLQRWQAFPGGQQRPAWWNKRLNLWVFKEEDKDVETLRYSQATETKPLITLPAKEKGRSEVKAILDNYDRFQTLQRKLDEGKRLTKSEQKWFDAYDDGDQEDDPPFEVDPPKPIADVAFLNASSEAQQNAQYNYINPVTKMRMTQAEFNTITKDGCDWCSKSLNWGGAAKFYKMQSNIECFCTECVEIPEVKAYVHGT